MIKTDIKEKMPWNSVFSFLSMKEIGVARLACKTFQSTSTSVFSQDLYNEELYSKFLLGIRSKKLSNANYMTLLHPYAIPYYEHIKELRKNIVFPGSDGKAHIHCSIFDLPFFLFETFTGFVHPVSGALVTTEELVAERLSEGKTFAQIFHTSDYKITMKNKRGDSLKLPKQMIMPNNSDTFQFDEEKEEKKEAYEAFFKADAGAKETDQIDFANQAMLCKRQELLLEKSQAKPIQYKPFELIKKIGPWVILMCHGGSFSIGIFNGKNLIEHKSDKKYLIRKKAGKRQANKDRTKSCMTSVGSQIRREMEKVHQEHIKNIMEECAKVLAEAVVIFLHAPGINRSFFLTEGKPLKPYISKIRPILVNTKKANFTNVMEVYEKLTEVNFTFVPPH